MKNKTEKNNNKKKEMEKGTEETSFKCQIKAGLLLLIQMNVSFPVNQG